MTRWSSANPRRQAGNRAIKKRVLVVGEGRETEPNYFRGLRDDGEVRDRFAVTVKKGPGVSAVHVVDRAIALRAQAESRDENFDEVCCVLDVEAPGRRPSLDEALRQAREHDICVFLSNPSFEVWLLAHFVRTKRYFAHCESVIQQLNRHWKRNWDQEYQKGDDELYRRLSPHKHRAVANAKLVREKDHTVGAHTADCNSSTEVYKLVGYMLGL